MGADRPQRHRLEALVSEPRINRLFEYWGRKRGQRAFPNRSDIAPNEIPNLLPIVFMLDVLESPRRYRYRLIGTELTRFAGRDATGQIIGDDLYAEHASAMAAFFDRTVTRCMPRLAISNVRWLDGKSWMRVAIVAMPMSSDGSRVDLILGGMAFAKLNEHPATSANSSEEYELEV